MVSLRVSTLVLSALSLALAQSLNNICNGSVNTTSYTDSCGVQYVVYCNSDANNIYSFNVLYNVPDFATCMSYCSDNSPQCDTVTYYGTTCYLKRGFRNAVRPSSANSAVVYQPVPAYPAPVATGQNRSVGCGVPLNSLITAGGASVQFTGTGPDGYLHSYNVHVPSTYDPNKAAPLIIGYHGRGDSGPNFESASGLSIERFNPYGITVYPTGINDNTGQPTWQGDPSYVGNHTIDDMGFTRALIANMSSQFCIDTGRIFAAGMSNGGGFVNVLACDPVMSTAFNAFAPHSGALYTMTSDGSSCLPYTVLTNDLVHSTCSPARRAPMLEFHGDNDGTIGYFGGGRRSYCLPAIPHWTTDWATRNNLTSDNITTVQNGGNVTRYEFGSSSNLLGLVSHYRLAGWSHTYSFTQFGGPIDAAAYSLNFFYRWTNPAGPRQDYLGAVYSAASASSSSTISCPSSLTVTTTYTTTSSTSTSSVITTSTSSATPSSTPSPVSYSCPSVNGTTVVDNNGTAYAVRCNTDTAEGGTYGGSSPDFNGCFSFCDSTSGCGAWTYSNGNCYLKIGFSSYQFANGGTGVVSGIRIVVSSSVSTSPMTSASPLSTAQSGGSGSVATTVSAVPASSTLNGYPVSTNPASCPGSNGTYYYDPYVGPGVNGLYYFIMCGYDIQAVQNTLTTANSFQDCFAACDALSTCTSFTYHAGQCYLKRIVSPYVYNGGDYVQASQNPVRGNLVTATPGATTTSSTSSNLPTSSPITTSTSPSSSLALSSTTSLASTTIITLVTSSSSSLAGSSTSNLVASISSSSLTSSSVISSTISSTRSSTTPSVVVPSSSLSSIGSSSASSLSSVASSYASSLSSSASSALSSISTSSSSVLSSSSSINPGTSTLSIGSSSASSLSSLASSLSSSASSATSSISRTSSSVASSVSSVLSSSSSSASIVGSSSASSLSSIASSVSSVLSSSSSSASSVVSSSSASIVGSSSASSLSSIASSSASVLSSSASSASSASSSLASSSISSVSSLGSSSLVVSSAISIVLPSSSNVASSSVISSLSSTIQSSVQATGGSSSTGLSSSSRVVSASTASSSNAIPISSSLANSIPSSASSQTLSVSYAMSSVVNPTSTAITSSIAASNPASVGVSSSVGSSAISSPSTSISAASSTTTTQSYSTGTGAPLCPGANGTYYTDSNHAIYQIYCSRDTEASLLGSVSTNGQGIIACMTACNANSACDAFTYVADTTQTQGTCYLKSGLEAITSATSDGLIVGVLISSGLSSSMASSATVSTLTAALSSAAPQTTTTLVLSSSSSDTRIPVTPSPYSTLTAGSSSSATATYVSQMAPAPACSQAACPAVNNSTCTDADGKAYNHQCDTTVTGGTVIVPADSSNTKRGAELLMFDDTMMSMYSGGEVEEGLKKRQTSSQQAEFQQCQAQCDSVSYCRAVTYNTSTNDCQMFAQISGTGYSPNVLFAQRAPARDAVTGPVTSTIYSTEITTVTSCPPDVQSCPASSTVVSTSLVPVSVTVSSASTATATSYSSYCGGTFVDSQTPPNNYSISCTTDYTNTSITTFPARDLNVCINTCSQVANCVAATWIQSGEADTYCYLKSSADLSSTTPFPPGVVGYAATRINNAPPPSGPITVTIYSTDITTVTSCASDVTSCPARSTVVSSTLVAIGTSISSVIASTTSSAPALITSTIYSTELTTVTSCPPDTPNCPASSTVISTTLVPVGTSVISMTSSILATPLPTSTSSSDTNAGRSGTASTTSSSLVGIFTSTIYSTGISTIVSSSSTVISTSLVPISVTISTISIPMATSSSAVGVVTSTIYSTDITTITSCSPGVVSCPASSTVVSTTLVPISVTVSTVYTAFSTSWYTTYSGTPFSTASSTAYSTGFSTAFSSAFSSAYSSAFSSAYSSAFSSAFSTASSTAISTAFSTAASSVASSAASSFASSVASSAASSLASSAASSGASSFASSAASSGALSFPSSTVSSGAASIFSPSGSTPVRSGTASTITPASTSTSTYSTGPITITVRPSTCPALQTLTTTVFTTGYVSSCAPDVVCSSSMTM